MSQFGMTYQMPIKKNFMRQFKKCFVYFGSRHYTYIPKLVEENKTHLRGYGKEID